MRKKTKIRVIVSMVILIGVMVSLGAVFFYQEMRMTRQQNDYEVYIKQLMEVKKKGFILTQDVAMGTVLKEEDIKEALFDPLLVSDDFIESKDNIVNQTVKIDLKAKQMLTASMLYESSSIKNDLREFELSSAVVPSFLKESDYVDIRINMPTGLDYVVLSKKKVDSIFSVEAEQAQLQYLRFRINADEILRLSSAIVDAFYRKGTYLYALKYVEPDAQKEAIVNYPVNEEVRQLILSDPNIVNRAQLSLEKNNRDALIASFAGYEMTEVRDRPQNIIEKKVEGGEPQAQGQTVPVSTEDSEKSTEGVVLQ